MTGAFDKSLADNLDERERLIYADADQWWATRFLGRGAYDKLGPFKSEGEVISAVMTAFKIEEQHYPPPSYIVSRPFAIYASSANHGDAHVIVGNVYRDQKYRPTHKEVSNKIKEEKERVTATRRSSRRRNAARTPPI